MTNSARCPTCEKLIGIDPSRLTGEVSCPRCRVPLWFVVVEGKARLYLRSVVSPRKQQIIEIFTASSPDSLDLVELVMELDEEFGSKLFGPEHKVREIRSVGELIDYIIRELPD